MFSIIALFTLSLKLTVSSADRMSLVIGSKCALWVPALSAVTLIGARACHAHIIS